MQVIWKPVLLGPTMRAARLGGVRRVSWPELPPPWRWPGSEPGAEWPAAPSPSLLPLHYSFPLVSGWGRARLAWLHAAREQHAPCLVSLQGSHPEPPPSSNMFPNGRVAEDSPFTARRTGTPTYHVNVITKGLSNKREAGRYFRQNTSWSNQPARIGYKDFFP